MRVVCCLCLLLSVVGCAPKSNGDVIDPERCDTVQGIMKYDELKAQGTIQKKIFCDFEKKGEMVVENLNTAKKEVSKIEIKEEEIEDIEALFNDALTDQCPDCLAASKEEADVVVKADIIRFVGHVKNYEASGDESMIFSGGDRNEKFEYQAALTVETNINGKVSQYDHIIDLSVDGKTHVEKMYAVVAASTTSNYTTEFVTKYDSIPLATGAILFSSEMNAYLGFNTWSHKRTGYFDIYDLSNMEVERHLDLSKAKLIWWWDDKEDKEDQEVKDEIIALYSSGVGGMRYLVYDYIKNLLAEVHDAQ